MGTGGPSGLVGHLYAGHLYWDPDHAWLPVCSCQCAQRDLEPLQGCNCGAAGGAWTGQMSGSEL